MQVTITFFSIELNGYVFQNLYVATISCPCTSWRHRWGSGGI